MQEDSPYKPPLSVGDKGGEYRPVENTKTASLIQWLQRVTLMFIGSLMIGISFALLVFSTTRGMTLLNLGVAFVGGLMFVAGMMNRRAGSSGFRSVRADRENYVRRQSLGQTSQRDPDQ